MARGGAVQDIGLQHGVMGDSAQGDVVVGQHAHVVLEVVAQLGAPRVLEQGPQPRQGGVQGQLPGEGRVVMGEGHIGGPARRQGKGQAYDLGTHGLEAGGLDIEHQQLGLLQVRHPPVQGRRVRDRLVVGPGGVGRGVPGLRGGVARVLAGAEELPQPALEFQVTKQLGQRRGVGRVQGQGLGREVQGDIALDGGQLPGHGQDMQAGPQVLAHLAPDGVGVGDDLIQAAVGLEPLHGGLGSHARDAGDIVGGVPHQGEVIHDLFGRDAELVHDPLGIELGVGHGVDQGDVVVHQLGHVLVAGGDQHRQAVGGGLGGQGPDDIVGLDPLDDQQGQPHGADAWPAGARPGSGGHRAWGGGGPCTAHRGRRGRSCPWRRRPPPCARAHSP